MITHSVLSRVIKKGNLTWTHHNGIVNHYGDGSGDPIKIRTIIDKIVSITGSGTPLYGERKYREGESMSLYANIDKARKLLNWEPKINIDDGLNKTINYYKKYFDFHK